MGLSSSRSPKGYGNGGAPSKFAEDSLNSRDPPEWLQKAHADCTKPLNLAMPPGYDAKHGDEGGMSIRRKTPSKSHVFFERWRINGPILLKASICFLIPPMIFMWTATVLSFSMHFTYPKRVWVVAFIALAPVLFSVWATFKNWQIGLDTRWSMASTFLFFAAWAAGTVFGDVNYLVNLHNFYFVSALKSYSNIKPKEITGTQLMDAGRVQFAEGTRLKVEMGMSFTMWDTYCVAPILAPGGMNAVAPGSPASYDLWAVGKNCCSSDNPAFMCGEYRNPDARSGLRQSNEDERVYFALAVQQAEAAYGITAAHPIFFHWVEDPDRALQTFFTKGFRAWVFMIFSHFCINAFIVVLLMNAFKYSNRALFAEEKLPGHYMMSH